MNEPLVFELQVTAKVNQVHGLYKTASLLLVHLKTAPEDFVAFVLKQLRGFPFGDLRVFRSSLFPINA